MISKEDIEQYVDYTYNSGITTYDHGDYLRVTNGSAGYYADFAIDGDTLLVKGERYGERFTEGYFEPTQDDVEAALHECLGL